MSIHSIVMAQSDIEVVRPLGNLERLYLVRNTLRYSANVCTAVRYQCKDFFSSVPIKSSTGLNDNIRKTLRPMIYSALTELILKEPALAIGIRDPKTSRPLFVHIPTIYLSRQVRFDIIQSDEKLEKILEREHDKVFDLSIETTLLWRVIVGVNVKRNDEICVIFCYHYSMTDGIGFHSLNTLFYNSLNNIVRTHKNLNNKSLLSNISSIVNVPYAQIFKPCDELLDTNVSVKLLMKKVFSDAFLPSFMKSKPDYCTAREGLAMDIKDFHTKLKIVTIDSDQVNLLLSRSKQQKTTLYAVIHTALLFAACHSLADLNEDKMLYNLTPISIRLCANPPITDKTLCIYNFSVSVKKLNQGFWNVSRMYKSKLAKSTQKSIQRTGRLKFTSKADEKWGKYFRRKRKLNPMGRKDIPNIGVWTPHGENESKDTNVKILDCAFSQSPDVSEK